MKKFTVVLLALLFLFAAGCNDDPKDDNTDDTDNNDTSLKGIYAGKFLIGNIINPTYMTGKHNEILKTHYNAVTCENDMKPDYIAPTAKGGAYRFTTADAQVDAMIAAGMQVHGHTLVWHSQTPAWLTNGSKDEVEANMIEYITDVMTHFKGKVKSWDVVNEAFPDNLHERAGITTPLSRDQDWKVCLRENDSKWFVALGADYIELAFKTARTADPDAILYYNDYGLNGTNKPMAVRNMIEDVNTRYKSETGGTRNLIEGIGMQGHYSSTWLNDTAIAGIERNMRYYLELGIRVDISELDIEDREVTGANQGQTGKNTKMTQAAENTQATNYAKLFKLFLKLDQEFPEQITRVTMWGIDDKTSWKSLGNPCLYDGNLNPKKAFDAVANPNSF